MAQRNQGSGDRKGKPEHKVAVSGSIQVYRPPEIEQRHSTERKEDETTHKAERKEDRGRETTRMWLEGLTLLAVLVYAGITFWQGTLIPQDPKKSPAFVTVRSDFIVKNGADIISKTDGSFAIVGVVTYYDSAGTHYRSDFCMLHTANGNVAWCIRHNDIH